MTNIYDSIAPEIARGFNSFEQTAKAIILNTVSTEKTPDKEVATKDKKPLYFHYETAGYEKPAQHVEGKSKESFVADPTSATFLKMLKDYIKQAHAVGKNVTIHDGGLEDPAFFILLVGAGKTHFMPNEGDYETFKTLARRVNTTIAKRLTDVFTGGTLATNENTALRLKILSYVNEKYLGLYPDGTLDSDFSPASTPVISFDMDIYHNVIQQQSSGPATEPSYEKSVD